MRAQKQTSKSEKSSQV